MAGWDGEYSRAGAVADHDHRRMRNLHDTFPFNKEECLQIGSLVQRTFIRHAAHGE